MFSSSLVFDFTQEQIPEYFKMLNSSPLTGDPNASRAKKTGKQSGLTSTRNTPELLVEEITATGRGEGSTKASEEAEQMHLRRFGTCCFTGGKAIGTRGTDRAYPLEMGLDILTSARRHLARSYERGPWKVSAHHLSEGNAPALGSQPLTHLLSSLGSSTAADGALE